MIPHPLLRSVTSRALPALLALVASSVHASAQDNLLHGTRFEHRAQEPVVLEGTQPQPSGWYQQMIEVALSDSIFELGYRQTTQRARDYYNVRALVNDDDDILLSGRLVRQGQVSGMPLRLGAGLGAYATWLDEPDEAVYAVTLIGVAEYDLKTAVPTTLSADLALAPSIATFGDGEDLFEFKFRATMDVSEVAAGFVGFRWLETETDSGEFEVDRGFHAGIRLAL